MKYVRMFFLAVMAGIAIGIGGIVFLSSDNKVVGAVMFSTGLYTICVHGLNLFTGKVGYLVENPPKYLIDLLVIWLGNFTGTIFAALGAQASRINGISEKAMDMCNVKSGDSLVSLFILGIFCGLLMYVAVDGYKKAQNPLLLFFCVACFILCGFEHCVADMFYFAMAGMITPKTILCLIMITLGNSVGGILIPLFKKIPEEQTENSLQDSSV